MKIFEPIVRHPLAPPRFHPEKAQARGIFQRALAKGKFKRPDRCSACNKKSQKIVGHHPDYTEPLSVIWLCKSCHRRIHGNGLEQPLLSELLQ